MLAVTSREIQSSSLVTDHRGRRFSHDEIRTATHNFNEASIIGHGGFGYVYKGYIKNGSTTVTVAIKQLSSLSNQGSSEFMAEIKMLSQIRHCNLVSLIGYCDEGCMALVYEYMPHGTLEEHLHKTDFPLSWLQRLKICIGVARGLDYLHTGTGTRHGVIHRDVKSSNILLDQNFEARISDFGHAKIGPVNQERTHVSTGVKGTFGYLDPCYFYTGELTSKSDVYSLGVVLLEVMCGRPAVDSNLKEDQWGLASWALGRIKEGKVNKIIDKRIRRQISKICVKKFAHIARRCLHSQPNKRPTMAEIVSEIQVIHSLQQKMNSLTNGKLINKIVSFFSANVESEPNNRISGKSADERNVISPEGPVIHSSSTNRTNGNLRIFTFQELLMATRNFRFGTAGLRGHSNVHKGWIHDPSVADAKPGFHNTFAVKKFIMETHHEEWLAELDHYSGKELSHPNIVNLIGYCREDYNRLLVYEFMPGASLDDQLFRGSSYFTILSWDQRIKVALGAAKGLAYLHSPEINVIFCSFKLSSILIDSNYNAKLYNFGLAKNGSLEGKSDVPREVISFDGYTAPEYIGTGQLTTRSDIYSFGVVLLEIMSGMRCLDEDRPRSERILTQFAKPYLQSEQRIQRIMDSRIKGQYTLAVAVNVGELVTKCLLKEPTHRPTANEVVQALEQLR